MEHREPHSWYAGLDLYHKQLSTHAQQIIRAIRSEHTRSVQNSGDHKSYQWNLEMEDLSADRQNVSEVAEFQEVGYCNDMEREEANFVEFQPGNVKRQKTGIACTDTYTENQTERCCTDRLDNTFLTSDRSAQRLPVTSYHLHVGSEIVNTEPKTPLRIKELHATETQKTDLGSQSEHIPVQLLNDLAANLPPEDWGNFRFDVRHHGVPACRDQADSVQQRGPLAQQGSLVNQYLGLPGLNETLTSSTGRLSSVQEEKKDNCLKRKMEKPANMSTPKQPVLYGWVKEHHNPTTKGMGSAELQARPQISDLISLDSDQRPQVLEEVARAASIILTMVYQDGSTQLTAEKEPSSSVSGFLVLLSNQPAGLFSDTTVETQATEQIVYRADTDGRFFHLKLEPNLSWLQRGQGYREFTRALLLQIVNHKGCIIAFKAKDLLRTVLHYAADTVCWKQASSWKIFDPRVAGWLLEPTDTFPCFKTLVLKHCGASSALELTASNTHCTGHSKLQELCVGLRILHRLMLHVYAKLQSQHLWKLFCLVELRLIPVLAVMENYRIQVNKEDLKRTSELLGVQQKQLEQEAHRVAGEQFLLTSNNQLRQILYDKLRLHLLCEKKIRKTDLKQQQSTSEAVLLQLQELHPLPKIILEYRQIHKIKSTYIDGLQSCMRKGFVSPTWNQTGTVSGRLSAKHPVSAFSQPLGSFTLFTVAQFSLLRRSMLAAELWQHLRTATDTSSDYTGH